MLPRNKLNSRGVSFLTISGEATVERFVAPTIYASSFLLTRIWETFLVYCEHDKQWIRTDNNWLSAFNSSFWIPIFLTCLVAVLLSNICVESAERSSYAEPTSRKTAIMASAACGRLAVTHGTSPQTT